MIEVENVSKYYGKNTALKNVSFSVKKGEILGFLGPNGAGKSTTMNIITGYLSASEGTIKVDGIDILENPMEVKKKIGYLPERPPLYKDMTVEEYLKFVCSIKKVDGKKQGSMLDYVIDVVKIADVRKRLIKNLSKGYQQRVGIAQAIIGDPDVLILDEPTVGLDPKQIIEIRRLIKELGKKHTIILSSHILPEVNAVCDRVLIINKGRLVANGTPEELSKKLSYSNKIMLRVKSQGKTVIHLLEQIPEVSYAKKIDVKELGTMDVLVEAKKDADVREAIFTKLNNAGIPILMMQPVDLTLEEIFLEVTTQENKEN